jgi:hypothetical protein
MAKIKYKFIRDVTPEDWYALPKAFKASEKVFEFIGHDYGCCRDDMMYGGVETIACCLDPAGPFFTVRVSDIIESETGARVRGEYARG